MGPERGIARGPGQPLSPGDPARHLDARVERVRNLDRERDIARLHDHDFHVRDVRHFNEHEFEAWRHGYWHHDWYNGRFGWWFDVGGLWYPYAAPVFPFPLVVAPLVVADAVPVVEVTAPAVVVAPLPAAPAAAYYCGSPAGYYPTVALCPGGWTTQPAY
jgi:hypothetical protein